MHAGILYLLLRGLSFMFLVVSYALQKCIHNRVLSEVCFIHLDGWLDRMMKIRSVQVGKVWEISVMKKLWESSIEHNGICLSYNFFLLSFIDCFCLPVFLIYTLDILVDCYFVQGLCTLTLCASIPALQPAACVDLVCPSATAAQYAVFFIGLYLVALGTGGIKPCIWPFGADQFDDTDPREKGKKGSFFNWFYFSNNIGAFLSSSLVVLVQEDIGWGIGYGIPTLVMAIGIVIFFLGTPFYRLQRPGGSPLTRICQVFVASFHKQNLEIPKDSSLLYETQDISSTIKGSRKLEHSDELK